MPYIHYNKPPTVTERRETDMENELFDDPAGVSAPDESFAPEGTAEQPDDYSGADGKPYYTPDEMRSLDFASVDTSRIPPEHVPFYKSMQASFTKAKQAEHERLRRAAKRRPQQAVTQGDDINMDEYRMAHREAERIIRGRYGADGSAPDSSDPAYSYAVAGMANQIIQRGHAVKQAQAGLQNEVINARDKYGSRFQQVDLLAQSIVENEYPTSVSREIYNAAAAGNYAPLRVVLDEAAKRLGMNGGQAAGVKPPAQEGAGGKGKGAARDATARLLGI